MAMTPKQQAFAAEYVVDNNATAAAIRAGYSQRSAGQVGYQMLQRPEVAAEVRRLQAARRERAEVTAADVLRELAAIALLPQEQLEEARARTADKLKALELLGKHLGMFTEKLEASVTARTEDGASLRQALETLPPAQRMAAARAVLDWEAALRLPPGPQA